MAATDWKSTHWMSQPEVRMQCRLRPANAFLIADCRLPNPWRPRLQSNSRIRCLCRLIQPACRPTVSRSPRFRIPRNYSATSSTILSGYGAFIPTTHASATGCPRSPRRCITISSAVSGSPQSWIGKIGRWALRSRPWPALAACGRAPPLRLQANRSRCSADRCFRC